MAFKEALAKCRKVCAEAPAEDVLSFLIGNFATPGQVDSILKEVENAETTLNAESKAGFDQLAGQALRHCLRTHLAIEFPEEFRGEDPDPEDFFDPKVDAFTRGD